ncbi:MAG TPA: CBS domain-containing protein [Vicinamibacteria bacterium]|jgi:CBS domain-containing protein
MGLLKIASVPAAVVTTQSTVIDAVKRMGEKRVGAVAVLDNGQITGIFTERDVMMRVVLEGRDPKTTKMSDVMTKDVVTVRKEMPVGEALRLMVERHFRHLPVVGENGQVFGILSVRNVLQHTVEDLSSQLDSVVNFFSADGPGG